MTLNLQLTEPGKPPGEPLLPSAGWTPQALSEPPHAGKVGSPPASSVCRPHPWPLATLTTQLRTYPPSHAPQLPAATPEDSLPRRQRGSPFLQPSASQRSHPTAHSILNGHAPRISSRPPISIPTWGAPPPPLQSISEGHTPKLAGWNSPEARAGVAAAAREHGPAGGVMVSCTSRLLFQV